VTGFDNLAPPSNELETIFNFKDRVQADNAAFLIQGAGYYMGLPLTVTLRDEDDILIPIHE